MRGVSVGALCLSLLSGEAARHSFAARVRDREIKDAGRSFPARHRCCLKLPRSRNAVLGSRGSQGIPCGAHRLAFALLAILATVKLDHELRAETEEIRKDQLGTAAGIWHHRADDSAASAITSVRPQSALYAELALDHGRALVASHQSQNFSLRSLTRTANECRAASPDKGRGKEPPHLPRALQNPAMPASMGHAGSISRSVSIRK